MKTKQITQGAVIATIYMLILLIVLYVPLLNAFLLFFLPVPFIVHMHRFGLKQTILVGVVCFILTLIVAPLPSVLVTVMAVSVGLVMGYLYVKRNGAFIPILAGMVSYIINFILLFAVSFYLLGVDISTILMRTVEDSYQLTEGFADFLNMPGASQEEILDQMQAMILSTIPAIMMLAGLLMAFLNHLISRPLLSRLGFDVQKLPLFRQWNLPKSIFYYYLAVLIVVLFGILETGSALYTVLINVQLVLEILLLIQGLTLISHFAYAKGIPQFVTVIMAILAINPFVAIAIRILGILDLGMKLKNKVKP